MTLLSYLPVELIMQQYPRRGTFDISLAAIQVTCQLRGAIAVRAIAIGLQLPRAICSADTTQCRFALPVKSPHHSNHGETNPGFIRQSSCFGRKTRTPDRAVCRHGRLWYLTGEASFASWSTIGID